MIFYWSDDPLDTPKAVRLSAKSVEVDPLDVDPGRDDCILTYYPLNRRPIDNNIGHNELITVVLSEDTLSSTVTVGGQTVFVKELVLSWEAADFRWIEHPLVNDGEILEVGFLEKPTRTHPGDFRFLNDFEYKLAGKVFHLNK